MKYFFRARVFILCTVCTLGLCGCTQALGNASDDRITPTTRPPEMASSVPATMAITAKSQVTMPDMDHMLLYPDATNVGVEDDGTYPPTSKTWYETSAEYLDVLAFYAKTLPEQGWVCEAEPIVQPCDYYFWGEPSAKSNFDVSMNVETLANGVTRIGLLTRRWPNVQNVPIYPDARNLNISYKKDEDLAKIAPPSYSVWQRVITYTTSATLQEVSTFYQSELLLPDWQPIEGASSITSDTGLQFRYYRRMDHTGGQSEYQDGYIQVKARAETSVNMSKDAMTEVELVVVGPEVKPQ
jgi:hypothetical protein